MRRIRAFAVAVLCLGPWAGPVAAQGDGGVGAAQSQSAVDFAAWEREAVRAENLIAAGRASTALFENLRSDLAVWRADLIAAQAADDDRVATIEAQVEALGPVPEDGAAEPDAIAARRTVLAEELARALEPVRVASEGAIRAEGLIRDIDALLRDRRQRAFLDVSPSPLNPINWPGAATALRDVVLGLDTDMRARLANAAQREQAARNAPLVLPLLLAGILAIARGGAWVGRLTRRLQRDARLRGHVAVAFVVSLSQVLAPLAGVVAILSGVAASGLLGASGLALLEALGILVVSAFGARWLAGRLFPDDDEGPLSALGLDDAGRAAARRTVVSIGVIYGLGSVIAAVIDLDQVSPAARGVLTLPVVVLLALSYWRSARVLRPGSSDDRGEDGSGFARGAVSLFSKGVLAVALVGPLLAAAGYTNAAEAVVLSMAETIGILGLLIVLQPVVRDLYALAFRTSPGTAAEALLPVALNFLLIFAAIPVLALIWGVRPDRLGEIQARFWEGMTIGGIRLTPGMALFLIAIFCIGIVATRLLQGALKSKVLPRTRLDAGARNAVSSGVGYVGVALAAVIAVTAVGIDLTALGFVVGALSIGIGFGLQNVVSNFVSGIILLIERPISEGDWIEVGGNMGIVKAISVRSTRIETFDRTDVIVPNADFINGTVTNWTRGNNIGRAVVTVGVAYGTDTRRVQEILTEIAKAHPDVADFPEPGVDFLGFGADSLDFRIRAILRDVNKLVSVKTELHHRIAERFAAEGIEIPFAQRDIWLRNPEALRPGPPPADTERPQSPPEAP